MEFEKFVKEGGKKDKGSVKFFNNKLYICIQRTPL